MSTVASPFISRKMIFEHQGPMPTTDVTIVTDYFTFNNADKVRFEVEALNVNFTLALRKVDSKGNRVYVDDNTPAADYPLFDDITVTLAGGRKAFETLFDADVAPADFDSFHPFWRLVATHRADTAYTFPTPTPTGIANLHNSTMLYKDEKAPLLRVKMALINPKQ